uniref:PEGA domain-containing protein n=1 Tax=Vitiosangium cumulatum TaxID=1867796 RepID=A0A7D4XHR9_9BACT|nr:hypothetical protein [Vitiosangium cumulatum]
MTTGRRVTRERPAVEPVKETRSTTKQQARGGTGRFWGVIAVLLVLGGGLGFAAVKLIAAIKEQEASGTPIPVGDVSPMLPIERPGQKTGPKADTRAKTDTGPAAGTAAAAKTQPPAGAQEGGKDKDASADKAGDGEPVRKVKQGALTLIVLPEAEVFLNGRSLGKTPLIKTPVPVGRHRLRIKGADGKRRELSVPIEAGKTAQFKLALTDIPEH